VLRAVVTQSGGSLVDVKLFVPSAESEEGPYKSSDCAFPEKNDQGEPIVDADGKSVCLEGPSPIMPEVHELLWGGGSFVVFALLMRFVLYPRMKAGTDSRYAAIRAGHESADAARASARSEVADYEAALDSVKAEAAARVHAARSTLDDERNAALVEANARIAVRREAAAAEAEAARQAVRGQIESAVADVASRAVELAVGKRPDDAVVAQAVADSMSVGVR
jgi:F-type H+-transporting ATPase subunit b